MASAHWAVRLRGWGPAIVVGVLVIFALAWPFITNYYSYNAAYYDGVVASAGVSAVLTISLNLAMGYGGMLSMMHTGLQLIGGYAVGTLVVKAGLPWPLAVLAAVVVGVIGAALVVLISLRATYLYFGMITLAANLILVEAGKAWEPLTGGDVGIPGILPAIGDAVMPKRAFYYVVLGCVAIAYIVQRNLVRSGAGRAAMAVREDPDTATALGIRPATTKIALFAVAGGLGGLAGALYALQLGFINPEVGVLENGLIFFVGLFIGGVGTLAGPLLGVGLIAVLVELIKDYARYTTLILGVTLLLAMMLIPRGIVGTWRDSRFGRSRGEPDKDGHAGGAVPDIVPVTRAADDDAPALEGIGLVKHFGGVHAVDGMDISVAPGTVHGIIGPNGSGKSTLVSCLTRFHRLDAGQVLIGGRPAPSRPWAVAAAGVTRVFQIPHLFERQSVLDNVLTGMRSRERYGWWSAVLRLPRYHREDRTNRARTRELLAFAGLSGQAEQDAGSLSHGQKRLLEVVRAVAAGPRVLILDEPATGLVPEEIEALSTLARAFAGQGLAIVLIEHNMDFVMRACDTITVIESGRLLACGPPARIRDDPAVLEAYLGRPDLVEEAS